MGTWTVSQWSNKISIQRRSRPVRSGMALAGLAVAATLALAACSTSPDLTGTSTSGSSESAGAGGSGVIRIAYIQKQGDQQYFIDQGDGAKAAAADLGAEVTMINVGDDANAAISQLDTVIAQGFDAIAIVVPDQKIGPQVIRWRRTRGSRSWPPTTRSRTAAATPRRSSASMVAPWVSRWAPRPQSCSRLVAVVLQQRRAGQRAVGLPA